MPNPVVLRRSTVPGKVPLTTDIILGEFGYNTYDGKLYGKKNSGLDVIFEIGAVYSVAGRTGVITLAVSDVSGAAPLASPIFTGTPTAPTPITTDNSTAIATTAYVRAVALPNWLRKTTAYTAAANDSILADTSAAAFTITLPLTPAQFATITFVDTASTFDTNNLTVARNGNLIMGLAEDMVTNTKNASFSLVYDNTANGWRIAQ